MPQHYAGYINKWNYTLPYQTIFGGICAFFDHAFERVNGFSNEYWGWGGEDDDLFQRTRSSGFKVQRPNPNVTRYTMISHGKEDQTLFTQRGVLLKRFKDHWKNDGLSVSRSSRREH